MGGGVICTHRAFEGLGARTVGQKRVELGKELCLLTAALALALVVGFHHRVIQRHVLPPSALSRESKHQLRSRIHHECTHTS